MAAPFLAIVSILYLLTAVDYARKGNYGLACAFFFYALANLGFILAGNKK